MDVSTDQDRWSKLTVEQFDLLKLRPENKDDFDKKQMYDKSNANAAYFETVFTSEYSDHRFFVQHLGAVRPGEIAFYVLAREPRDRGVYSRS